MNIQEAEQIVYGDLSPIKYSADQVAQWDREESERDSSSWRIGPSFPVNGVPMATVQNKRGVGVAYVADLDEGRLIAAAPDLLEALGHLLDDAIEAGLADSAWSGSLIEAHSAICKATGQTA